jgi:hypothetical protein
VYWLEAYASHRPVLFAEAPALYASRTQTERLYVPVGDEVEVIHVYAKLGEYGCTSCQLPPGAAIQNWYRGLGHPDAVALTVTFVPTVADPAGVVETFTDEHSGGVSV